MRRFGPKYIGRILNIQTLRAYILELTLTEQDTLLLHPDNFDELVLEYRSEYQAALPAPYFLLGVLIDEAGPHDAVPLDRVVVLYEDNRPHRLEIAQATTTLADDGRRLYQCKNCGTLVTPDGLLLHEELRKQYVNWLIVRQETPEPVAGECCYHM